MTPGPDEGCTPQATAAGRLAFDDYISPHEAADRLHFLSAELEQHKLDPDCVEELRLISQRFTRHLNVLEAFTYHLEDIARALRC